jgi:hypothetical protein
MHFLSIHSSYFVSVQEQRNVPGRIILTILVSLFWIRTSAQAMRVPRGISGLDARHTKMSLIFFQQRKMLLRLPDRTGDRNLFGTKLFSQSTPVIFNLRGVARLVAALEYR